MDEQNKPTTQSRIAFDTLPGPIIDWLNSEEVFNNFLALEKRFSIPSKNVRVLPDLIEGLVTGALLASSAATTLQQNLGCSAQDAGAILLEIKERIINPISIPLRQISGIDLTVLPGVMPSPDKSISIKEVTDEEGEEDELPVGAPVKDLEPLVTGPARAIPDTQLKPVGMETPGLRTMKDVKAPEPIKKPEPTPIQAPKIVETPRPFMLHEEKPIAPTESAALRVNTNFSFDAGPAPVIKTQPRPATAELGSSFDAILDKKKPVAPVTAKTVEIPKVVHYTSLKTPLDDQDRTKG